MDQAKGYWGDNNKSVFELTDDEMVMIAKSMVVIVQEQLKEFLEEYGRRGLNETYNISE